jgi:hypothetical protein
MRQALFCLIGSTCFTLVSFISIYTLWMKSSREKLSDPKYRISVLVQTGPEKEALQTAYLAELLDLSVDQPTNLYRFDVKKGKKKLLSSPLIAEAEIKKIPPHTLYIDYEVRKPVAWLGDYQNIAIDKDGYLFPMAPFFAPKELPEIYLGLPPFGEVGEFLGKAGGLWQTPLQNPHLSLAFEMLRFLEGLPWREGLRIKRIDVSSAFAPSLGQREIVLFTEEDFLFNRGDQAVCCTFPKMLRLSPKEYAQQMNNFLSLRKNIMEDYSKQLSVALLPQAGRFSSRIVDLRIPHLAFVEN